MRIVGWTVLVIAFASGGVAGDGVVEINQQAALAGGITPDDFPGFPVTLSQPGSYRLVGPLSNEEEANTIHITADDVTLDLAGHSLTGPNICAGSPVTSCVFDTGGMGIFVHADNAVIRNGAVLGMRASGITGAGFGNRVEDVVVRNCGNAGIYLGPGATVYNCTVERNLYQGIEVGHESSVVYNNVYFNGIYGVVLSNQGLDGRNLAVLVADNAMRRNGGYGLYFTDSLDFRTVALYSGNVITSSAGVDPVYPTGIAPQYPRDMGDNLCNNDRNCDGVTP